MTAAVAGRPDAPSPAPGRPVHLYVLVDPRDRSIRYAGVTRTALAARLTAHIGQAIRHPERRGSHKDVWIRSLHRASIRPLIIAVGIATEDTWRDDERDLIAGLRWMGCDLTNITAGGDGYVHDFTSDVAVRRATTRRANRTLPDGSLRPMYTPEGRARQSARARAQTISDDQRQRLREIRIGKPMPGETRAKISATTRGRSQPAEHVARRVASRRTTMSARRVPPPSCIDCGSPVSRRPCVRCKPCSSLHTLAAVNERRRHAPAL